MLEPTIVAAGILRDRTAGWREILSQVNELRAQLHPDNPHARAENAFKLFVFRPEDLDVGNLPKRQL